jgi:excinuclease ABC subunit C
MKLSERVNYLNSIVQSLPDNPGVYQFFNTQEQIIYVGKAKNLKKRVSSYFQKQHQDNGKLRVMISKIYDIRYIIVDTESDALLLENNLIKSYQPRYNVLLKDDKSFPWICIKNERFPRVFSTRNIVKDGSLYFGPYTSVVMVRTLLDLIRQLFPLRNCNLNLTDENIKGGKFKTCLEFHMGNCKAPCVGNQTEQEYDDSINQIKNILKGNIYQVIGYLKNVMKDYAEVFKFEEAEVVRRKIEILEKFQSKSTIVNPSIDNVEVFSISEEENVAAVNFMKVMNGAIIQSHTVELIKRLDENKEELLALAMIDIRERFKGDAREILVPFDDGFEFPGVTITVPKIGDKKKLLDLSLRNTKYFLLERQQRMERLNPGNKIIRILEKIKSDLHLKEIPTHIECFDNSNIQGTNPVAACVVFKNGSPAKSEYRHFNIKTVTGPNDFASMEEIVYRRYKRLLEEEAGLPQLIVIDGGKGQLHAAVNSLQNLDLYGKIAVIGIAKRLEEIYFPGDTVPIYLNKNSETLKVIQHLRNEAHRFGITFHRNKRSASMVGSELDYIPGIGPKTVELLYNKYGSLSAIKKVPFKEIEEVLGKKKALLLKAFLNNKEG